ncbi:7578_t:CDS:1, partial [Scutellospora calospora]
MNLKKSVDVQFALNITPGIGILKPSNERSSYDELSSMWPRPYQLTINENELIMPAYNSRRAVQYRNNPTFFSPPRPPNEFVLFRKNFYAKLKSDGLKVDNKKISGLASKDWRNQPPS